MLKDVTVAKVQAAITSSSPGGAIRLGLRGLHRWRRSWRPLVIAVVLFVVIAVAFTPTIICRSPLGRWFISRNAALTGLTFDFSEMHLGWRSPLRLSNVVIHCRSEMDHIRIDRVDWDWTLLDMIRHRDDGFGHWLIRGVSAQGTFDQDRISLETELHSLIHGDDSASQVIPGRVELQEVQLKLTERSSNRSWQLHQANFDLDVSPQGWKWTLSGAASADEEPKGSIWASLSQPTSKHHETKLEIRCNAFPLSAITLLKGQLAAADRILPSGIQGAATGALNLSSVDGRLTELDFDKLTLHRLKLDSPTSDRHRWRNQIASMDGSIAFSDGKLEGTFHAMTDFATAEFDGSIGIPSLVNPAGRLDPFACLQAFDGVANATLDFASLHRSLPGVIPLPSAAKVHSGTAQLKIEPLPSTSDRRLRWSLKSDPVKFGSGRKLDQIAPIEMEVVATVRPKQVIAESFQLATSFATVSGQAETTRGSSDIKVDLHQLDSLLSTLGIQTERQPAGAIQASIRWQQGQDNTARTSGKVNLSNVRLTDNQGRVTRWKALVGNFDIASRGDGFAIDSLQSGTLSLIGEGLEVKAILNGSQTPAEPGHSVPLTVDASGQLTTIADFLRPWTPAGLRIGDGEFTTTLTGYLSSNTANLTQATIELKHPQMAYGIQSIRRRGIHLDFDGHWSFPDGRFHAKSLSLQGDAFSANASGDLSREFSDLHLEWKGDLASLAQDHQTPPLGHELSKPNRTEPVVVLASATRSNPNRRVTGHAQGSLRIQGHGDHLRFTNSSTTNNLTVQELVPSSAPRVIWSEPKLRLDATIQLDRSTGRIRIDAVQIAGNWFSAQLSGTEAQVSAPLDLLLTGTATISHDAFSEQLTLLAGIPVRLDGQQKSPVTVRLKRNPQGSLALAVNGQLEWASGEVAGVKFGSVSVPVCLSEQSLRIDQSVIPVGKGKILLAGDLQYRPGPAVFRVRPGVVAESIELSSDITDRWVKFIAPPVQHVEHIQGTFGAEIDEAIINLRSPEKSKVIGRLNIDQARMSLTPMVIQLMQSMKNMRTSEDGTKRAEQETPQGLITVPTQVINFDIEMGVAHHQRALFDVDHIRIASSGAATADGKLALIVEVPRKLVTKADKTDSDEFLSIPVTGTFLEPRVDPTGIGSVLTLMSRTARHARNTLLGRDDDTRRPAAPSGFPADAARTPSVPTIKR